jgi:hypothetical protein
MRLSCDAPLQMWDEFIVTASYLSTLTASTAAGGKTLYELWFGTCPSISHLCEIGSRVVTNRPHAPFKWAVKDSDKRSTHTRQVRESWDELQEDNTLIGRLVSTDPCNWPAKYAGKTRQMARRRVRFT